MHGVEQSEALTRAAQRLSGRRKGFLAGDVTEQQLEDALIVYKAAYKAYTDPFGTKTYA